jgi:hypothetical protein
MTTKHPDVFLQDTGDFFRTYLAGDEMTRRNLALGMHMKLHDQNAELRRARTAAVVAFSLLVACIIGIVAATH